MVLGFKQQFVYPIISGSKIHTIREDKGDRWQEGKKIQMATGVRTKNYNCFHELTCTGTQEVFMTYAFNDVIQISVDGNELHQYVDKVKFAHNDGFETWEAFFNWFYPLIQSSPTKCFKGKVIHWTDHRYE